MNFLRLLPVVLSFLLLAAHFHRAGLTLLVGICAFLPLLLFLRKPWVPQFFQAVLVMGALEWLRTLYVLAEMRIALEQPWNRLAVVLGAVALFTALAGLVFNGDSLRARYCLRRAGGSDQPGRP